MGLLLLLLHSRHQYSPLLTPKEEGVLHNTCSVSERLALQIH